MLKSRLLNISSRRIINSRVSWNFIKLPVVNYSLQSKKLKNYQKLRRQPDPFIHQQSKTYLLSILHGNDTIPKEQEKYLSNVTAVTIGDSIDFEILLKNLQNFKFDIVIPDEVINIEINKHTSLMILSNGTLIGWNLTENIIMNNYFPIIKSSIQQVYQPESDEMYFVELDEETTANNNGNSYLQGEIFIIQGNQSKKLLDKAAFAIGLSRSTRLGILENSLESLLQSTKENSLWLSLGQIKTNEQNLLKLTGRILLLRGKLNLHSELIEIPDLYWEEPSLEKIYYSISKVLDINSRISILNRKLDYAYDEQHAFLTVLNEKKSTRLEWIIIILIMVEVGFESYHFIEKNQEKQQAKTLNETQD